MTSSEIREKYLKFFEKRGHTILPSAPLVPENDPTTLFNTAGMQPLVPYLLGEPHPGGKRLANIQKCVRTGDIDEVGDNTHLTFFEMMGNWSLGDYFKEDAIKWSFELLTSKKEGFGLDPQRLYVTCFEGNEDVPKDEESASVWKEIFEKNNVTGERIYFMPAKNNWWQPGPNGPCGPDTEMFYDLTDTLTEGLTKEQYLKADDEQKIVEIWNDVFMQYMKKDDKIVGELPNKNVDTGSGFERVCAVLQGKTNVFDTDLFDFAPTSTKQERIVADHTRAAVFLIADGVTPSNTERSYVLRRLIRRAIVNKGDILSVAEKVIEKYKDFYNLGDKDKILSVLQEENNKFNKVLGDAEKDLKKYSDQKISGQEMFLLFSSKGIPVELAESLGYEVDRSGFEEEMQKHQEVSKAGSEQKFKGGLGGHSEMEVRYHTATHLLHQALREVLGEHVEQKGSNITPERLRFDFVHPQKMTDEEKQRVEEIVNQKIKEDLPVNKVVMKKEEAEKVGALHFFGDKYGEEVSVYYIGDSLDSAWSKEFCGGPHVERTSDLASERDPERLAKDRSFKILKEEAISQGIRRIKAVLS